MVGLFLEARQVATCTTPGSLVFVAFPFLKQSLAVLSRLLLNAKFSGLSLQRAVVMAFSMRSFSGNLLFIKLSSERRFGND